MVRIMITESQLLNHIYQTAEMGCSGVRTVMKYANEDELNSALYSQLCEYRKLQASAGAMLKLRGKQAKGISKLAKLSTERMTDMKTRLDHSATNIAEMMIQGNTMGVTKSIRTMRDCDLKDERVRDLANKLLKTEEANIEQMKAFL